MPGDTNASFDVFVRDRKRHTTKRVSLGPHGRQGDGDSLLPSLSADGRYVAFASAASTLAAGDSNHLQDIFRGTP